MSKTPLYTVLAIAILLVQKAATPVPLIAQNDSAFRNLGIKASSEDVTVELVGTYYEGNANHLRVKAHNHAETSIMVAVDVRRGSTLWFPAAIQTQFCLPVDRGKHEAVDIPFPLDFWKFYPDSETSLAVMVSSTQERSGFPQVLRAYDPYIPRWNLCIREPDFRPGETVYQARFPTDSLFDRFYDPEEHFHVHRSPSFDVYVHRRSLAREYAEDIIRRRECAFQQITELLGVEHHGRIRLVFYPDDETKAEDTMHRGAGYAWRTNVVEIYSEEVKLDDFHEIAHVVVGLIGSPPAMLNEGFAVHISEALGAAALESFGHGGRTIDQAVKYLHARGKLLPIGESFGFTEIGSEASRGAISYPQAASFTRFIIHSHGYGVFGRLLAELRNSSEPEVIAQNKAVFREITGISLQEQADRWLESLNAIQDHDLEAALET